MDDLEQAFEDIHGNQQNDEDNIPIDFHIDMVNVLIEKLKSIHQDSNGRSVESEMRNEIKLYLINLLEQMRIQNFTKKKHILHIIFSLIVKEIPNLKEQRAPGYGGLMESITKSIRNRRYHAKSNRPRLIETNSSGINPTNDGPANVTLN